MSKLGLRNSMQYGPLAWLGVHSNGCRRWTSTRTSPPSKPRLLPVSHCPGVYCRFPHFQGSDRFWCSTPSAKDGAAASSDAARVGKHLSFFVDHVGSDPRITLVYHLVYLYSQILQPSEPKIQVASQLYPGKVSQSVNQSVSLEPLAPWHISHQERVFRCISVKYSAEHPELAILEDGGRRMDEEKDS